ncbi:phosphotransferase enzyme family protein [Paenibacillus sp. L3-i20]|uniref:phosphotransferase enzyme family protein n=1 Tax=Paenibacillus sp. L3-i20 TaxID=2905833 RepID=UPI001EDF3710|nr:phosphotransferase [Paenibacillus sp. L3-i20]GKU76538.1 hypothetical protein L3i20_v209350 [Paenibacillus sp. L3-i20]
MHESNEQLAAEIALHLNEQFGLTVTEATPIEKGFLNVKWRMTTNKGNYFIKYYHPERYKMHIYPARRAEIEQVLQLQDELSRAGIPCSNVYSFEKQWLQETKSGLFYTVQDWVDGHTVQAGSMNRAQMYHLGQVTGQMHKWLERVPPLEKNVSKPVQADYFTSWQNNWQAAQEAGDKTAQEWLSRSQQIVQSIDFNLFDSCPIGWMHWDLWVDNILLHEQGVTGIVDFDRMTMAYPEIDVARVILSGALSKGHLDIEKVEAFMSGYREHSKAPADMLPRALKLLYVFESIWWLRTEIRAQMELRSLLGRFVEELHWIEDNWDKLPHI